MLSNIIARIIIFFISLPVSEGTRNQLLVLMGIIISGIFAFSSTTIFINLMAGMMLRVTKPFLTGDFVRIEGYFGRVTERGLLDTEIQTEDQQLVALPNSLLINRPISVIRSSSTIVSVTLSLGYDIHHAKVETILLESIELAGLDDAFVQIIDLGNNAITYKANGILTDTKTYLTVHSNLRRQILDNFHNNNIEIVSPSFINQRRIDNNKSIIPNVSIQDKPPEKLAAPLEEKPSVEAMIFDKAEIATIIEEQKAELKSKIQEYESELTNASSEEKKQLKILIKDSMEKLDELRLTPLENNELNKQE